MIKYVIHRTELRGKTNSWDSVGWSLLVLVSLQVLAVKTLEHQEGLFLPRTMAVGGAKNVDFQRRNLCSVSSILKEEVNIYDAFSVAFGISSLM